MDRETFVKAAADALKKQRENDAPETYTQNVDDVWSELTRFDWPELTAKQLERINESLIQQCQSSQSHQLEELVSSSDSEEEEATATSSRKVNKKFLNNVHWYFAHKIHSLTESNLNNEDENGGTIQEGTDLLLKPQESDRDFVAAASKLVLITWILLPHALFHHGLIDLHSVMHHNPEGDVKIEEKMKNSLLTDSMQHLTSYEKEWNTLVKNWKRLAFSDFFSPTVVVELIESLLPSLSFDKSKTSLQYLTDPKKTIPLSLLLAITLLSDQTNPKITRSLLKLWGGALQEMSDEKTGLIGQLFRKKIFITTFVEVFNILNPKEVTSGLWKNIFSPPLTNLDPSLVSTLSACIKIIATVESEDAVLFQLSTALYHRIIDFLKLAMEIIGGEFTSMLVEQGGFRSLLSGLNSLNSLVKITQDPGASASVDVQNLRSTLLYLAINDGKAHSHAKRSSSFFDCMCSSTAEEHEDHVTLVVKLLFGIANKRNLQESSESIRRHLESIDRNVAEVKEYATTASISYNESNSQLTGHLVNSLETLYEKVEKWTQALRAISSVAKRNPTFITPTNLYEEIASRLVSNVKMWHAADPSDLLAQQRTDRNETNEGRKESALRIERSISVREKCSRAYHSLFHVLKEFKSLAVERSNPAKVD